MICTSPCFPKCTSEATQTLRTINKVFLGHNCDVHIPKVVKDNYHVEPIAEVEETYNGELFKDLSSVDKEKVNQGILMPDEPENNNG